MKKILALVLALATLLSLCSCASSIAVEEPAATAETKAEQATTPAKKDNVKFNIATDLPDGMTEIRATAFNGCTSLTSIAIPASLDKMGEDVFKGCTALASIVCGATAQSSRWNEQWLGDCTATVTWAAA